MVLLDGKLDGTVCEVENCNKKAICQFLPTKHFFYDLYISIPLHGRMKGKTETIW